MFFSISKTEFDNRFVNHYKVNNFYISTDNGWNKIDSDNTTVFFKGYSDTEPLESIALKYIDDFIPCHTGNFCIIVVKENNLILTHDINRSFPLVMYNQEILTNFVNNEIELPSENIWSDSIVEFENNIVKFKPFDNQFAQVDFSNTVSVDDCLTAIKAIVQEKLNFFDQNSLPVKSFLSGGVDTMMSYAIAKSNNNHSIELVAAEHFALTPFALKNYQTINQSFWGYRQIHHWKNSCVLVSGACGDEMFMRGPDMAALWCAWNNYNVVDVLNSIDYSYHKKYFLRADKQQVFVDAWHNRKEIQKLSYNELCEKICNNIVNDHQHWHIENTITWTPFKDIRILQTILCLRKEDLFDQILHGSLDRKLIEKFDPELNNYICTHKNHNQYHNLLNYNLYMESAAEF
jgi:asparagine synthetase B (glutamine-hydrolysing)